MDTEKFRGGLMDEAFENRVRAVTGMSLEDAVALGGAQEELRVERIRAAGYCCAAGMAAADLLTPPSQTRRSCPWHGDDA